MKDKIEKELFEKGESNIKLGSQKLVITLKPNEYKTVWNVSFNYYESKNGEMKWWYSHFTSGYSKKDAIKMALKELEERKIIKENNSLALAQARARAFKIKYLLDI